LYVTGHDGTESCAGASGSRDSALGVQRRFGRGAPDRRVPVRGDPHHHSLDGGDAPPLTRAVALGPRVARPADPDDYEEPRSADRGRLVAGLPRSAPRVERRHYAGFHVAGPDGARGLRRHQHDGHPVPYSYTTSSWEGSITLNSVNTLLVTNDGALTTNGSANTFG